MSFRKIRDRFAIRRRPKEGSRRLWIVRQENSVIEGASRKLGLKAIHFIATKNSPKVGASARQSCSSGHIDGQKSIGRISLSEGELVILEGIGLQEFALNPVFPKKVVLIVPSWNTIGIVVS